MTDDVNEKISVLIVDDSDDKLVSLEACISDLGLNIVRARSGRDALRCLLNQNFAAILLDVDMPGMDGFETAALIRQRKNLESTPILFITAYGDKPFVSRGYALGAVDYMLTPVFPEVLRTKVSVFAELYRKTLEVRQQAKKLQQRADQLAALAAELAQAEQRERRRIAQLLHDNLQQLLVAARMRLGTFGDAPAARRSQIVAEVDDLLNRSIEASRSLTGELSPPILYDVGLVAALEWLGRQMEKNHGLTVDVQRKGEAEFSTPNLRAFAFHAIRELLFNCVKHAGVDRAIVSVSRGLDSCIRLTVTDSGAGFDPASLEAGSGGDHFGLFSIRERARLMNGMCSIASSPGAGTSITIELPDAIKSMEETESLGGSGLGLITGSGHEIVQRSMPVNGDRVRVLLVDDHEILRKGLLALLSDQHDIEVVGEAMDGPSAIDAARRIQPDVVVMDVAMPGMSGIEATRRVKKECPAVHVIGLSLHRREDMAAAMTLAGASAYLSKGGPPEALIEAIRQVRHSGPAAAAAIAAPASMPVVDPIGSA